MPSDVMTQLSHNTNQLHCPRTDGSHLLEGLPHGDLFHELLPLLVQEHRQVLRR